MKTQQFIVYGRVQCVGFRYFTYREAQRLGIFGWVKNQNDGSVAVLAQGTEQQLAAFQQWLHKGPKTANVTHLECFPITEQESLEEFRILH